MVSKEREKIEIPICCNVPCIHIGEAVIRKDETMNNPINGYNVYIKFKCPRCGTIHAIELNTYELVMDYNAESTIY